MFLSTSCCLGFSLHPSRNKSKVELFSLEKRSLRKDLINTCKSLWGVSGDGARLFSVVPSTRLRCKVINKTQEIPPQHEDEHRKSWNSCPGSYGISGFIQIPPGCVPVSLLWVTLPCWGAQSAPSPGVHPHPRNVLGFCAAWAGGEGQGKALRSLPAP